MKAKDIKVLFESEDFLVVSKPSGLLVIPDRWDEEIETITDVLAESYPELYVVHRIDRETSGVLVLAKTREAHRELSLRFEEREVEKTYLAIVRGSPSWTETEVDLPLRPDGDKAHRTVIDMSHGKPSVTRFKIVSSYRNFAVVEARPETGRTHQIRVHLAHLGHTVLCDPLYGDPKPLKLSEFKRGFKGDPYEERPLLSRLALHAQKASFPWKNSTLEFEAPLFKDMKALMSQLEKNA